MRKFYIIFLFLTCLGLAISYKIKDDYYHLPYPNAIEYVVAFILLLLTATLFLFSTVVSPIFD
ncbi:hypothetical protein [Litoribacter populi]|uniref:hypothetical protein n=1 Tax=Litoribacter populi TaxID=2598460 RepID=UPI00117D34DD|nr:hypothetical protein [Litoribacter populi]